LTEQLFPLDLELPLPYRWTTVTVVLDASVILKSGDDTRDRNR
jgi:hypothetical protein